MYFDLQSILIYDLINTVNHGNHGFSLIKRINTNKIRLFCVNPWFLNHLRPSARLNYKLVNSLTDSMSQIGET